MSNNDHDCTCTDVPAPPQVQEDFGVVTIRRIDPDCPEHGPLNARLEAALDRRVGNAPRLRSPRGMGP